MLFFTSKRNIKISAICLIIFFLLANVTSYSQTGSSFFRSSDTLNKPRRNTIIITEAIAASATLIGLNQLWYAEYPRSSFHFHNDNKDWLQMDKLGHAFTTYYVGKMGMDVLAWSGESKKNQLLYGATLGFAFMTAVEVLDGFSQEWGFSTGDMIANGLGTGLLIGQELLWDEQRMQLKFSFHTTDYASINPSVLGENTMQQILKDYNGQTYWLSMNLWSFFKESKIPKWFNIAVGYGANGVPEKHFDTTSNTLIIQNSYRQFFTSIDIDLTKIQTKSGFLKTAFDVFNCIKIPAPTLEYSAKNKFEFHFLYF